MVCRNGTAIALTAPTPATGLVTSRHARIVDCSQRGRQRLDPDERITRLASPTARASRTGCIPLAQRDLDVTLNYFRTPEAQQRALDILNFKLDLLWSMLDAIEKAHPV
jgi:hypothetical protein